MKACARTDPRSGGRQRADGVGLTDRMCMCRRVCARCDYVGMSHAVLCSVVGSQLHVQGGWGLLSKPLMTIEYRFPIFVQTESFLHE